MNNVGDHVGDNIVVNMSNACRLALRKTLEAVQLISCVHGHTMRSILDRVYWGWGNIIVMY